MPEFAGVSHVSLSVRDLPASADWYQRVLGLSPLGDVEEVDEGRIQLLVHPDSGIVVSFSEHDANGGERFDEIRTGLDHVSFLVTSREELDAWATHFSELGVEHSPVAEADYGSVLVFRDPDHIQLELFHSPLQVEMTGRGA